MKIILTICMVLMISAANAAKVTDVIDTSVTAINPDGTFMVVNGAVTGIVKGPVGDYQVKVTNGGSFKNKTFSEMNCNILPISRIIADNKIPLVTTYFVDDVMHTVTGYFGGTEAYPTSGYKVTIKNGKNKILWNSMNCVIK